MRLALTWTVLGLLFVGATVAALRPNLSSVHSGRADQGYVESSTCLKCHADHYESWARTYHSRMTREARRGTVQGDFEHSNTLTYLGAKARMEMRGQNFVMDLAFPDGQTRAFTVDRTVGSRRMEQYLTRLPGRYERLPLAFDLINRRWMHLNGSFFYPDGTNYFQHQALWDGNCVFCHNVKAQPHYSSADKSFQTVVNELGIACGACHGPAAPHETTASSPFVRTSWRLAGKQTKAIVHPLKIDTDRALMLCGHCHGQRLPRPVDRIDELVTRGDPYNAGDDLNQFYQPLARETTFAHVAFASRFWSNGSPRLTAYEYQGVLRSKCFQQGRVGGRLNCLSCHVMHSGDPKGQITAQKRSNQACLQCHEKFSDPTALAAHTGHKPDSAGSRCYDCHMPRVVYGVMSVHPTHEITVPDPQLTATAGVPNACNQCHLDRSVNWSIRASKQLWPARFASARTSDDDQFELSEGPRALFAGDAVVRALAAEALAGGGPAILPEGFAAPYLLEAWLDNYAIVRFFAADGLRGGSSAKPDYLAELPERLALQKQLRLRLGPDPASQAAELAARLRARRAEVEIEVGE